MANFSVKKAANDVSSINADYIVPPKLTTTERDALTGVSTGALIFNITESSFQLFDGTSWNNTTNIISEKNAILVDNFTGASTTSGTIGNLGWSLTGATTANGAFSTQNHPFTKNISINGTVNNAGILHLNYLASAGNIVYRDISEVTFSMQIVAALNRQLTFVGISENWTITPQNNVIFRKIGAIGATWQCDVRVAGVLTTIDTGVVVTNNFTKFKIKTFPSKVEFYINDVLSGTINTAPAATILMQPAIDMINNGALNANTFLVDYFLLKTKTLSR